MRIGRLVNRAAGSVGLVIRRKSSEGFYRDPKLTRFNLALSAYFYRRLEQIADVEGDIVECGVGRGVSLLNWCTYVEFSQRFQDEPKWPVRQVWGFDSFEGLPAPTSEDVSAERDNTPHIRAGLVSDTSVNGVIQMLERKNVSSDFIASNLHLVPGWFDNTLSGFEANIALLHVDVDLYDSYVTVLNELYDKVVPGGVIAFDEYDHERYPGATKAIDAFFADKPGRIEKDTFLPRWYYVTPRNA